VSSAFSGSDGELWNSIVTASVDEQATGFLKAYVMEFGGNKFEEVLAIAAQFKNFMSTPASTDLDEQQSLLFLEKRGETRTATQLRQDLKQIDLDSNRRMALLEYVLFKWQKKPSDFFAQYRTPHGASSELLSAIARYREIQAGKDKRQRRISELEGLVAAGGVKGRAAQNELEQLKAENLLEANKSEITAAAQKRKAEKSYVDPMEEEKKRLAKEAEDKAAADKAVRDVARGKLAAKASLWNNQ